VNLQSPRSPPLTEGPSVATAGPSGLQDLHLDDPDTLGAGQGILFGGTARWKTKSRRCISPRKGYLRLGGPGARSTASWGDLRPAVQLSERPARGTMALIFTGRVFRDLARM